MTTNPDATTLQTSYSGCGCAGGAVVTITDEAGRRQKLYSDVLGRQVKIEVLNWNGTEYSTRTTSYNARDQVTSVKQYQGLESSGIYQEVTKTYDGHGRLAAHKDPIQTTATIYTYNSVDQPLTVTDARGTTQTFTYNDRNLPTQISYSNYWQPLTAVTVGYDAAGNRISTTDGTGITTYQYNQLSQLISETRQFTGLSGSFMLNYEYNLAGALKAFTDHAGSRVDYGFNSAGMLTAVTGSGAHSIPTYLSNIAYRAWGAIKDMDFGNGAHQHLNFNARQRNTSITLSNGSISATWTFAYHADGKIQKVTDSQNPIFDRAFDYDHIGRLQEVRTGSEARGVSTPDGPFKQSYTYDVWENTIARTHRIWSGSLQSDSATFTDNRRQFWLYDNEGNLGGDFDANYGYDAAGRQNLFVANVTVGGWPTQHPQQSVMEISQTFAGDSRPTKKTTTNRWEELVGEEVQIRQSTSTVYYLRSTVLGGKVIAELDDTGYKRLGYVFAGGMQIATQHVWNPGFGYDVSLAMTSPATGSEYMVGGTQLGRKELDPLGTDVTQPPTPMLIPEPVFYNPKFDQMPLQIEGGPSDEYELANADWAILVTATIQAAQERGRAEELWQSGNRSEALAILQKNPNVGIEYRALVDDKIVSSGSYFGQAAADFLYGLNLALEAQEIFEQNSMDGDKVTRDKEQILRADFEQLLRREDGDCLTFARGLLLNAAINTQRPLYDAGFVTDPVRIFDEVLKQGGVVLVPTMRGGGAAQGSLGKDDKLQATMLFKSIPWGGLSFVRGEGVFHESAHFAPASGVFSDRELSWAGYQALYSMGYTVPSPPSNLKDDRAYSEYFHFQLIFRACNPNQRRK